MPQTRKPNAVAKMVATPIARSRQQSCTRLAAPLMSGADPKAYLPVAVADAPARQVVRAHFDADSIAQQDADAEFAHLPTGVGQQLMPVIELHFELRIR